MLKAITLRSFPTTMEWKECIKEASSSGYEGVEINFDGRFNLDCSVEILKEIRKVTANFRIRVDSVYSRQQWWTPISSSDPGNSEKGIKAIQRLVEIASFLEARIVLVIPGAVDNSILSSEAEITPYDEVYQKSGEIIKRLSSEAKKEGVILGIENVPSKFLLSPLEMKRFIEEIGSPAVGCYFDVANCLYLGGYPEQWIRILGKHIQAIHIKDYKLSAGDLNGFVNIFEGDINWEEICKALAEIGYDCSLTSEVLPPFKHHPEHLWKTVSSALESLKKDIESYRREIEGE